MYLLILNITTTTTATTTTTTTTTTTRSSDSDDGKYQVYAIQEESILMNGVTTNVKRIFVRGSDSGEYAEVGWILDNGILLLPSHHHHYQHDHK